MARGVNKVILIGNVGQEPEGAALPDGTAVIKFSLATSESWKDKNTGQQVEKTEWHKIEFLGKPAEILLEHLKKGAKLYVEGSLRTRKWKDSNDKDHYTTSIRGKEFQFLSSAPGDQSTPANQPISQPAGGFDSFDDDSIPF